MNKYNWEELKEKLERCKNIPIEEINPDDVDNIEDIKISRNVEKKEYWILLLLQKIHMLLK